MNQSILKTQKLTVDKIIKLNCTWRNVYLIKFNEIINDFLPGDSLGLIVENYTDKIKTIMNQFEWKDENIVFNNQLMLISDILKVVDITLFPKIQFLKELVNFAQNKNELLEIINDTRKYFVMVNNKKFVDIIKLFNVKNVPFDLFLKYATPIMPRHYTLINKINTKLEIIVGLFYKNSQLGHVSETIVTGNIKNVGLNGFIKKNKLLLDMQKKILNNESFHFFCTGLGITPYIAFSHYTNNIELHYGFRNDCDNILLYLNRSLHGVLYKSSEKNYLTNYIEKYKNQYINIFICGNAQMQKHIFLKLKQIKPNLISEKKLFFDSWI